MRYGTFATEELVKKAAAIGVSAMALTNINSTADCWEFVNDCQQEGIKPILGVEIRNEQRMLYLLIAKNNLGFGFINKFLSDHLVLKKAFPERPFFERDVFIIYPLPSQPLELSTVEFIGIQPTEINKLFAWPLKNFKDKFLVRQPVSFQDPDHYVVHKLLRAIDDNVLLSRLSPESVCSPAEYFKTPSELLEAFKNHSFIVTNTYRFLDSCSIELDTGDKTKKIFSATMEDDRVLLSKLAYDGMAQRYGAKNKKAKEGIKNELSVIDKLGFNAYYLISWDITHYAKNKGYYHVGRGSGANSIVAYCLGITDVDPIELELYFERFLNPHRSSPPDFDIDFSWTDRDDVFDYVFKRYGKDHVARVGMFSTFQYNAIIWELGKVYGLPETERKDLAEKGYYNGDSRNENFRGKKKGDLLWNQIIHYGRRLENFPDTMSVHSGGVLISDEPIYAYTGIYMPESGFPTTQIDMFVADSIGLFKLDILSQRGLGHIKSCLQLVKQNRGVDVNIHAIGSFKKDEAIRANLRSGNTIGCFYIESPAMRHVLKKLSCEDYETLVAASSIIRPGVGRSGMMREYIFRHNNPGKFQYLHPKLEEILKTTYGVMVYQENIIQVAHEWAGMDGADADLLRRSTSFKHRVKGGINSLRDKFFANCATRGYPPEVVREVWRQMESFGDFSFCKAHSASYAVESYQSLFLKTYYPMEFMVAVINNFGGYYNHGSRELYFYELMRSGARVHPPCVNESDYLTNISGSDVYVGFIQIDGLEKNLSATIIDERTISGRFRDLQDFIERTKIKPEQLRLLIKIDAFRFTKKPKQQLFWEGDFLLRKMKNHIPARQSLFKDRPKAFSFPDFTISPMEHIYHQVQLLGFPVCNPFVLVDDDPKKYVPAAEIKNYLGKSITVLGYHITHKPVRTIHNETMSFGTFIDADQNWIDTVHFPAVHRQVPLAAGFYRITGEVTEEFGVYSITAAQVEKIGIRGRQEQQKKAIEHR